MYVVVCGAIERGVVFCRSSGFPPCLGMKRDAPSRRLMGDRAQGCGRKKMTFLGSEGRFGTRHGCCIKDDLVTSDGIQEERKTWMARDGDF